MQWRNSLQRWASSWEYRSTICENYFNFSHYYQRCTFEWGLFPRDFIILDRITQHPDFNPWRLARGCKWVRCAILCNRFMHFRKETYEMIGSLISYGMFYIGPKDCWVRSPLCWNSMYLGRLCFQDHQEKKKTLIFHTRVYCTAEQGREWVWWIRWWGKQWL